MEGKLSRQGNPGEVRMKRKYIREGSGEGQTGTVMELSLDVRQVLLDW